MEIMERFIRLNRLARALRTAVPYREGSTEMRLADA